MAETKYSKQRELIKAYLVSTKEHPSADRVYEEVRKSLPNISLGTIYRNLNFLADNGDIQRVTCGDNCEHFDGNPLPHYHFTCTNCRRVLDLELEENLYHQLDISKKIDFDGYIEGSITYFYGLCHNCV